MTHPERIVPDATSPGILALHLKRYELAASYAAGMRVLDAACGVGYGSAYLAEVAAEVVGVDIDAESVAYAGDRYAAPNLRFEQMDVTALSFDDDTFDVVVSFETIEHVADARSAIHEAARVLRPGGTYLVSTPRVDVTTTEPQNPFHMTEYSPSDFEALLRTVFTNVDLYGQRRRETRRHRALRRLDVLGLRKRMRMPSAAITGSRPTTDLTLDDVVIERGALTRASEVVAVCSGV
jgi:2-polyprenyl-3-methyl-5-hydroxy-6-metoxy-1,4-benzoquinol methylase